MKFHNTPSKIIEVHFKIRLGSCKITKRICWIDSIILGLGAIFFVTVNIFIIETKENAMSGKRVNLNNSKNACFLSFFDKSFVWDEDRIKYQQKLRDIQHRIRLFGKKFPHFMIMLWTWEQKHDNLLKEFQILTEIRYVDESRRITLGKLIKAYTEKKWPSKTSLENKDSNVFDWYKYIAEQKNLEEVPLEKISRVIWINEEIEVYFFFLENHDS